MKILFVTREGYNLPGARYRCYQFSRKLEQYGFKCEVLSFSDSLGGKDGEREREMRSWEKIRLNYKAFRYIRSFQPDLLFLQRVHYHSWGAWLAREFKRIPLWVDMDDWEFRENLWRCGFLSNSRMEMFTRFLLRRAVGVSVSSYFLKRYFSDYSPFYLPSAVDTELFTPPSRRPESLKLSWIGTLHRPDNLENLRELFSIFQRLKKIFPDAVLEVVGGGYYQDLLEKEVCRVKGLFFRKWISPPEMPQYLQSVSVGLLPLFQNSRFNQAKSPVKLFEYFATGIPVVASSVGEVPYYLEDGVNGFLASSRDEFFQKLAFLLKNPSLREEMGKNARKTAEKKLSLKRWGEKLAEEIKHRMVKYLQNSGPLPEY